MLKEMTANTRSLKKLKVLSGIVLFWNGDNLFTPFCDENLK
jgi:hypothetical protein